MTEKCIRCGRERSLGEVTWYSNGWMGHPDWRWHACPDCRGSSMRKCWDLARSQVAKLLAGKE